MLYIVHAPSKRRAGRETWKDQVRVVTEPPPGWEVSKKMTEQLAGAIDLKEQRKQDRRQQRMAQRRRA